MFVFDTDTTSNFLTANRNYQHLQRRVEMAPEGSIYLSIITLEEMLGAQINSINRVRGLGKPALLLQVYEILHGLYEDLRQFPILPYDSEAHALWETVTPKVRNAHKQDARISAVAARHGFTLITRNTQDHEKIGLAAIEDWTLDPELI